MLKKAKTFVFLGIASISLTSCVGTIQAVQTGIQAYQTASAGVQGFYGYKMLQSLRHAKPIFKDYDSIKVEALVFPRKNIAGFPEIFRDNLQYDIEKAIEITKTNKVVCNIEGECKGKTIVVRFVEEGYKDDLAHRLFTGGKLRGVVQYIDKDTNKILHEDRIELARNYRELFNQSLLGIELKLLKELEVEGKGDELQEAVNRMNSLDPIKPEYKQIFEKMNS